MFEFDKCRTKEEFSFTLREALARKMSSNVWGNGFQFKTENEKVEKVFNKISYLNKLNNTLGYIEKYCSLYGRAILTINKTKDGEYLLNISDPIWFNGVGKVFVQPQLAVIYQRFKVSTEIYIVKSTYTPTHVYNELYTYMNEDVIRVFDKEAEVFEELQIEPEWEHNLGFPPIVEFTNLPLWQHQWMNMDFVNITDWFPAMIYEKLIWETLDSLRKELRYCHSRIFTDGLSQSTINQLRGRNGAFEDFDPEAKNDYIINTDPGSEVKIQQGNGDFTKYTNAVQALLDFYFKMAGSSRFSEGGGAQKTVAEVSNTKSASIENINQKIILRQEQCRELINKLLACYGCGKYYDVNDEYDFVIKGNINNDTTAWIDNKIKLINSGVITPIDLIQELFNVSYSKAKEQFEAVKKWNEENNVMGLFGEDVNESESGFNKETGEHESFKESGKQN